MRVIVRMVKLSANMAGLLTNQAGAVPTVEVGKWLSEHTGVETETECLAVWKPEPGKSLKQAAWVKQAMVHGKFPVRLAPIQVAAGQLGSAFGAGVQFIAQLDCKMAESGVREGHPPSEYVLIIGFEDSQETEDPAESEPQLWSSAEITPQTGDNNRLWLGAIARW